jgi:hypothetical protein
LKSGSQLLRYRFFLIYWQNEQEKFSLFEQYHLQKKGFILWRGGIAYLLKRMSLASAIQTHYLASPCNFHAWPHYHQKTVLQNTFVSGATIDGISWHERQWHGLLLRRSEEAWA